MINNWLWTRYTIILWRLLHISGESSFTLPIKDPNSKNVHIFVTPSSLVRQIFDKVFSITVIISTRWSNGFFNWQIMTHFSHPGKKYNRSSLLSHENNSRHKKRAPERHVHFYYSNPLFLNLPRLRQNQIIFPFGIFL